MPRIRSYFLSFCYNHPFALIFFQFEIPFFLRTDSNLSLYENSTHTHGKRQHIVPFSHNSQWFGFLFHSPNSFSMQPLFLHRNLSYMRERKSRKSSSNKEFRVDSLLNIVTNRQRAEAEKNACPNNYLTIMFLGISDKSISQEQLAKVSIVVSKISQMKRKDCLTKNREEVSSGKTLSTLLSSRTVHFFPLFSQSFHSDGWGQNQDQPSWYDR